jgi:hypothetical protein
MPIRMVIAFLNDVSVAAAYTKAKAK